jgi:tripartite-type tricarboxylate transporter receptor subunit TctC
VPDVPTLAEAGVPGFDVALRYGLAAPAGTPRPIVDRLNKELNAALADPEVQKRLANEGAEALPGTVQDYVTDLDKEETKWGALVRKIGLKLE